MGEGEHPSSPSVIHSYVAVRAVHETNGMQARKISITSTHVVHFSRIRSISAKYDDVWRSDVKRAFFFLGPKLVTEQHFFRRKKPNLKPKVSSIHAIKQHHGSGNGDLFFLLVDTLPRLGSLHGWQRLCLQASRARRSLRQDLLLASSHLARDAEEKRPPQRYASNWPELEKNLQRNIRLVNLEIPVLVQSLKSSNVELG